MEITYIPYIITYMYPYHISHILTHFPTYATTVLCSKGMTKALHYLHVAQQNRHSEISKPSHTPIPCHHSHNLPHISPHISLSDTSAAPFLTCTDMLSYQNASACCLLFPLSCDIFFFFFFSFFYCLYMHMRVTDLYACGGKCPAWYVCVCGNVEC